MRNRGVGAVVIPAKALAITAGDIMRARPGVSRRCTATFHLNADTFARLCTDDLSVKQGMDAGRIVIEGNGIAQSELIRMLASVTGRANGSFAKASK